MFGFMGKPAILAILFAVGFLAGGYSGYRLNDNIWVAATEKLKSEAAAELQKATHDVLTQERKNAELSSKIGVLHAKSQKEIRATLDENRRLVAAIGGLRDKGRGPDSCSAVRPAGTATGNADGSPAPADISAKGGAILSPELSEFILDLAYDADQAASYAKACREWILTR